MTEEIYNVSTITIRSTMEKSLCLMVLWLAVMLPSALSQCPPSGKWFYLLSLYPMPPFPSARKQCVVKWTRIYENVGVIRNQGVINDLAKVGYIDGKDTKKLS